MNKGRLHIIVGVPWKTGECYRIPEPHGPAYGEIANLDEIDPDGEMPDKRDEGLYWVKAYSVDSPEGEFGVIDVNRTNMKRITREVFEAARARGWS